MRISIAPLDDKQYTHFKPVKINSLQDLVEKATAHNYSMGVFKDNYRNKKNFQEAHCIAIDVDNDGPNDNYTIDQAVEKFNQYKHIIMPSKSHRKEKNGKIADRFRVILFLESPITDQKDFTATWKTIYDSYPAADRACKDASRFYFPSPEPFSIKENGKLWPVCKYIEPVKKDIQNNIDDINKLGQLSRNTLNFFMTGAPAGMRNTTLFKAAKDMQEQGYTESNVIDRLQSMIDLGGDWSTDYVNEKDLECISNAFKEAPMYEPREGQVLNSIFNFQKLDEMIEEAGEIKWLAEGLLTEGGFSLMVGPPKAGKSTLVRQLVKSVCQGDHFLGRDITQGGVLYLTFEEQPEVLKQQFTACGIKPGDPLTLHVGNVFAEQSIVFDHIQAAIEEFKPKLVVLDTLFDIVQLESINDYKEVKYALAKMRTIGRETGAHILGVHHTNKAGEGNNSIMGSNAIHGALDTLIRFVQERERRYLFSNGKHGRHFLDQEIVFDYKTQTYTIGRKRDKSGDKL